MKSRSLVLIIMTGIFLITNLGFCIAAEVDYRRQAEMADEALRQLGGHYLKNTSGEIGKTTPHVWNEIPCTTWKEYGNRVSCIGIRHFDCSGFISFCAKSVGYDLGHLSPEYLYSHGPIVHIPINQICKGSIIFKRWDPESHKIGHVAIYLGDGRVIECGGGKAGVHITFWNAWLEGAHRGENYLSAGNLLYLPRIENPNSPEKIVETKYKWFGVEVEKGRRAVVKKVFPQSPAQEIGVKIGDIILNLSGWDFRYTSNATDCLETWKKTSRTTTDRSKSYPSNPIILIRDSKEIEIPARGICLELRTEEEIPPGSY